MISYWLDAHDASRVPVHDMPDPSSRWDAAVVGAGLAGLSTAVMLAREGLRVVVLEARTVGAVTTGRSTAKLSLLQGTRLSGIRRLHGPDAVRAYVDGSRQAQEWLRGFCAEHGVDVPARPAHTYATTAEGTSSLRAEAEACREAGLAVREDSETELPFPVARTLTLEDQSLLDPMQVLTTLARELDALGGVLVEGARLTEASRNRPFELVTTRGGLRADRLVLATGIPVLDRGGHAARLVAHRSYAMTFQVPEGGFVPHGIHVSVESDSRSLRPIPTAEGELLLVGGQDHVTGRDPSPAARLRELESWTGRTVPGAVRTHGWAAQDYVPSSALPMIDALPGSGGEALALTGFAKWGMTGAVAAALGATGMLTAAAPAWLSALERSRSRASAVLPAAGMIAEAGAAAARGWARAELGPLPAQPPGEGEGRTGRSEGRPTAISTVDGRTCAVSAVCPHLGGIVQWNDAELTWDCPLHGSRFGADGTLLEGPAVHGLEQRGDPDAARSSSR